MKMKVCNLILEVTRRCNMNCAHCLRGDAQNMDADPALIPKIFDGIDDIDTITFTGGEPALNTDYMAVDEAYVSCTGAIVTDCDLPFEDIDSGKSAAYLGKVTRRGSLAAILQKSARKKLSA